MTRTLVVGTRGSALALWQTDFVVARLRARHPNRRFEVRPIRTTGDRLGDVSLAEIGARGIFVDEIRRALLQGEIDLGVHSVKDLPYDPAEGIALAMVGPREDPRDALVTRHQVTLAQLPHGASLGAGSARRAAQLKAVRPDLVVESIRGNVDTRVRKALSGEYDAIVLAVAGLRRLGLESHITEYLPVSLVAPAPGQGAIGVDARQSDADGLSVLASIDHAPTRSAVQAEQDFARALGGGCRAPVGAYATVDGEILSLLGVVASPDGTVVLRDEVSGEVAKSKDLGAELARRLIAMGADAILSALGEDADDEAGLRGD